VPPLEIGTHVMARNEAKGAKYGDQTWVGPYKIIQINPTGSYLLKDSEGDTFKRNMSQLKVLKNPDDEDLPDSYTVEKILSHQQTGQKMKYLVKWKNYPHAHNSWVKADDFDDDAIISAYWARKAPERSTKRKKKKQTTTTLSSRTNSTRKRKAAS